MEQTNAKEPAKPSANQNGLQSEMGQPALEQAPFTHHLGNRKPDPQRLAPTDILYLQRSAGNQAVQRLLARQPSQPPTQLAAKSVQREVEDVTPTHVTPAHATPNIVQRDHVGVIEKPFLRKSNTVRWYKWGDKGFELEGTTVAKGTKLAQARPTIFTDFAWVATETGDSGYLHKENLSVEKWGPLKNPKYEDKEYLDENSLLTRVGTKDEGEKPYENLHREWYLDQAILMKAYRASNDDETKKQLALAMLQSFAKAATHDQKEAKHSGFQLTPLIREYFYHRSTSGGSAALNDLRKLIADHMGVPDDTLQLISDPSFMQVLAREFGVYSRKQILKNPMNSMTTLKPVDTNITDTKSFVTAVETLINNLANGLAPEGLFVLNVTGYYEKQKSKPDEIQTKVARPLEKILLQKATAKLQSKTGKKLNRDSLIKSILNQIQLVVLTKVEGVNVLLVPKLFQAFSDTESNPLDKNEEKLRGEISSLTREEFMKEGSHDPKKLDSAMIESGARLDPVLVKKAMLDFTTPEELLKKAGATPSELGTPGKTSPVVCKDINAFLKTNAFIKFRQLSEEEKAPPYQKIYPAATADLLAGLAEVKLDKGGLDKVFETKNITDVLQHAYFRMLNAMAGASTFKGNLVEFLNNIEVIHNQLQMILTIAEPHSQGIAFSNSIIEALKQPPVFPEDDKNTRPTVPKGLSPMVHHKASAMHSIASILSGIEDQKFKDKGTKALTALVLKDNYYEAHGAVLDHSKTYSVHELNGWKLRSEDDKDLELKSEAFTSGKMPPKGTVDIFICDFHHNISVERSEYRLENVTHQVDQLFKKGLVSSSFTVAIDCTVDFVRSEDIQKFLEFHKERITKGKLNVVLYRSAQKFDMLGMDNYYGGFTVTINDGKSFKEFNKRLSNEEDQVTGLSHQGLSHLHQFGSEHIEAYRKALMENTKKLYDILNTNGLCDPNGMLYIGKTTDPNNVFLDIQIPGGGEESGGYMLAMLKGYAVEHNLPLTGRPSFGFPTSNLTTIAGSKVRLNPGLEGEETIKLYAQFFIQKKTELEESVAEDFKKKPRDQWTAQELQKRVDFAVYENYQIWQVSTESKRNKKQTAPVQQPVGQQSVPKVSGPQGVPDSGVKDTKGLEKLLTKSTQGKKTGSQGSSLPVAAPLIFGPHIDPNPTLYFQVNKDGGYNFRVDNANPGGKWTRVEQFCAYLAVHWLVNGHSEDGLKFSDLSLSERQEAVQTLIQWSAVGLASQEQHAIDKLAGTSTPMGTVKLAATGGTYAAGKRIWFGTDFHAQAAVVLPSGKYLVYDPNSGDAVEKSGAIFATYVEGNNSFVVS